MGVRTSDSTRVTRSRIRIVFRLDDPSAISDHALEQDLLEVFRKYASRLTIAVVPFADSGTGLQRITADAVPHLARAAKTGMAEIAVHGYCHAHMTEDEYGTPSEFFGLDHGEQYRLVSDGLDAVRAAFDQPVEGFVPPWNTHDVATLAAAQSLGIKYVSVGAQSMLAGRNNKRPLVIPKTCSLVESEIMAAIDAAVPIVDSAPALVCVFHPDDFEEFRYPPGAEEPPPYTNLQNLDALLERLSQRDDVEVVTLGDLANDFIEAGGGWGSKRLQWTEKVSWKIAERLPRKCLIPFPRANVASAVYRSFTDPRDAARGFQKNG